MDKLHEETCGHIKKTTLFTLCAFKEGRDMDAYPKRKQPIGSGQIPYQMRACYGRHLKDKIQSKISIYNNI